MRKVLPLFIAAAVFIFVTGCGKTTFTYTDLSPVESSSTLQESVVSENPSATESPAAPFVFTPDHTRLPIDQQEHLINEEATGDWNTLIHAICENHAFTEFTDYSKFQTLTRILETSPYADLVTLELDDDCLFIEYSDICSLDTLDSSLTALFTESLSTKHNTLETLISLYRVAASFKYEESTDFSLYRTLVERKGNAEEIAGALQYMLTQAGFKAYTAEYSSLSIDHFWVIAEINGDFYHFDPVFESSATNGQGLSYFGMSDTAHAAAIGDDIYSVGFLSLSEQRSDMCPSNTFDLLFSNATQYQISPNNHTITVQYGFSASPSTEFSTEAFTN